MTAGSILLGLALLILVVLFVLRPVAGPRPASRPAAGRNAGRAPSPRAALLAEKELLLEEIQTLDFDHETGKVPDDLYRAERAQRVAAAAAVLKQLDKLAQPAGQTADSVAAEIERAVARLRQRANDAPRSPVVSRGGGQFCPQCGQVAEKEDKFCAHCGQQLRQKVT